MRLVVFDADDTLRRTLVPGQPCPHRDGEWALMPNVREVLSDVDWTASGISIGVASNQDHVGYGLVEHDDCERMLREMIALATSGRVSDPLIRFCPHVLEHPCECRKPNPGMLLDLMREANVAPDECLFVGNAPSDREAAARARTRFAWPSEIFSS